VNEEKLNELKADASKKLEALREDAEEAIVKAKARAAEFADDAEDAVEEVSKKAKGFFARLFGK
jgi:F0F1-type ATP synthase membrane subunit b/b'